MMRHEIEIQTDHFQFYVGDAEHGPAVDTSDLWGPTAAMVTTKNLLGVGTARFGGRTRILIEVAEESRTAEDGWSEVGSFSIELPSGEVVVWAPETKDLKRAPRISVSPGGYQGRVSSKGTETVTDEMATEGDDMYRVVLCRNSKDPQHREPQKAQRDPHQG